MLREPTLISQTQTKETNVDFSKKNYLAKALLSKGEAHTGQWRLIGLQASLQGQSCGHGLELEACYRGGEDEGECIVDVKPRVLLTQLHGCNDANSFKFGRL